MTGGTLTIVAVCSHNRARSVMAQLLLQRALDGRGLAADVIGAGFEEPGIAPLDDTVRALAAMGMDARDVRSRRIDAATVERADLVVTAERLHVVRLVEDRTDLFAKTFTLPELAERATAAGPRGGRPFATWLDVVDAGRTHAEFLESAPEIGDPAGAAASVFAATATRIDGWCRSVAELL
jgi:protein-tyrosine-phosphatase